MGQAVRLRGRGGVEQMTLVDEEKGAPGPHDVLIRQAAIGVNYVDIYVRAGHYDIGGDTPILGFEGAGLVEAVGNGVEDLKEGDRVAYMGAPLGAYTEWRVLPRHRLVRLADDVPVLRAGATLLRAMTAAMLLHEIAHVKAGDTVLVHAAAGGLGQIVSSWARHLGARVIGTVGSDAKRATAQDAGADHVLLHHDPDWPAEVLRLTEGRGVRLAVDGIGGAMPTRTIPALAMFGIVASIGWPAGPVPAIEPASLSVRAAAFARPSVLALAEDREAYPRVAAAALTAIGSFLSHVTVTRYALRDAARAHADLEAGRTTGSIALVP